MQRTIVLSALVWVSLFIVPVRVHAWISDSDVANAKANADAAQGRVDAAQGRLDLIVNSLRAAFEASAEYTAAKAELDSSSTDYDSDRNRVLDALHGTQEYQDACSVRDQAVAAVAQARKDGDAPEDIISAANDSMKARHAVTEMENKALLNDPTYQANKKRFVAANTALRKLEERYKIILATSPQYQRAKSDLGSARGDLTAADAAASDTQIAKSQQDINEQAARNWAAAAARGR